MDAYITPTKNTNYSCYIKAIDLTNHMGSISHHIMPLVIHSLGGGHTHMHPCRHLRTKVILRNQASAGLQPAHVWLKIGQFSEMHISQTTYPIFFKFGMQSQAHIWRAENCKFDRNQSGTVVIEIRGVKHGNLALPANNTLVCCASFLAADTRLCVLIYLCSKIRSYTN